jgi:type IV pilus assembly protein PilN
MIRVNLLPHRQERRAFRQRQMIVFAAFAAVLGVLSVVVVHTVLAGWVETQNARNNLLKTEIDKLDKQIAEIKKVKEDTQGLIARKQVVEALQANRSEAVHVLDQLLRVVPEGTYFRAVKQTGTLVNISGFAQSNARVSALMRNLEDSPTFESPELVEIKGTTVNNVRANEFNLNATITRAKPDNGASKKPEAKKT